MNDIVALNGVKRQLELMREACGQEAFYGMDDAHVVPFLVQFDVAEQ